VTVTYLYNGIVGRRRLQEEEDCSNINWEWRNKIAKTHQLPKHRGVKTGRPSPFWPGLFLARIKWAGPGWPDMVKRVAFLSPARGLTGWRADPPVFSHLYNLWPNQILIFFISKLVDWIMSQFYITKRNSPVIKNTTTMIY